MHQFIASESFYTLTDVYLDITKPFFVYISSHVCFANELFFAFALVEIAFPGTGDQEFGILGQLWDHWDHTETTLGPIGDLGGGSFWRCFLVVFSWDHYGTTMGPLRDH